MVTFPRSVVADLHEDVLAVPVACRHVHPDLVAIDVSVFRRSLRGRWPLQVYERHSKPHLGVQVPEARSDDVGRHEPGSGGRLGYIRVTTGRAPNVASRVRIGGGTRRRGCRWASAGVVGRPTCGVLIAGTAEDTPATDHNSGSGQEQRAKPTQAPSRDPKGARCDPHRAPPRRARPCGLGYAAPGCGALILGPPLEHSGQWCTRPIRTYISFHPGRRDNTPSIRRRLGVCLGKADAARVGWFSHGAAPSSYAVVRSA